MSDLEKLLAEARKHPMTAEQREEQRRSFVAGNVGLSNPLVTRELVDRVADSECQ